MMKQLIHLFLLYIFTFFISCDQVSHPSIEFNRIEELMPRHPDSALIFLRQAKEIETLSRKDKARYYLLLTEAQDKTYATHTTDSLITIATDYYEGTNDIERKAKAWYYKGRINQDLNLPFKAQECYLKALEEEGEIKDYALLGRINNSIGMLYTDQMVYDSALRFQTKAIESFRMLEDSIGQVFALRDLGRAYQMLELQDSAVYCYQRAISLMKEKVVASVYAELAGLYLNEQKSQEAKDLLQIASPYVVTDQVNYPFYLVLGRLFKQSGQLDSARYYLHACINSAPHPTTRAGALYYLKEMAFAQKQWEKVVMLSMRYESLKDSIVKKERIVSIRKTQDLYSHAQIEHKLLETQLYVSGLRFKYLLIISACVILLLGAFFSILHYRREKRELNRQQKENERRILRNERIIEDLRKVQALNSLQVEELTLLRELLEEENSLLKKEQTQKEKNQALLKEGRLYEKFYSPVGWEPTSEDWNALFSCIENDYPTFPIALQKALPNLREQDKKLCYLLKIKVKPSTISILLGMDNVSMPRKRLYEKLTGHTGTAKQFDDYIASL